MRHRLLLVAASGFAVALAIMSLPATLASVGTSGAPRTAAALPSIPKLVGRGSASAQANAAAVSAATAIPILYNQENNPQGVGLESQNFEIAYTGFSSQTADDFSVPAGHTWTIKEVDILAQESAPIAAAAVEFYTDNAGTPGSLLSIQTVKAFDNAGAVSLKLGAAGAVTLGPGTYWLSVYGEQDFQGHGQFFWASRTIQNLNAGQWRNPANLFGTGCTGFTTATACDGAVTGPDYMFRLRGSHT